MKHIIKLSFLEWNNYTISTNLIKDFPEVIITIRDGIELNLYGCCSMTWNYDCGIYEYIPEPPTLKWLLDNNYIYLDN